MRRSGTIDKFECSTAPRTDLQLFSAADSRRGAPATRRRHCATDSIYNYVMHLSLQPFYPITQRAL